MNLDTILSRGIAEVIQIDELRARLDLGRPLRFKMGFDPSSPNLHIGHAVGLRKLRQFQELGHTVVLVVGDWTAQIGDPSGRDRTRRPLSPEQVEANAQTYLQQFFKVVDRERTEVRRQSEWYGAFDLAMVFDLLARFTLQQMLAHETFRKRFEAGAPVSLLELIYPLVQAYDLVAIQADVEFGGTDQKFNILAGRELMRALDLEPQQVILTPLLMGADGRKMSKSLHNTIDLALPPEDMYGRTMAIQDELILPYLENVTDVPLDEIAAMKLAMQAGANPRDSKMRLARELVGQFHSPQAALQAEEAFRQVFQRRERPDELPLFKLSGPTPLLDLLVAAGLAASKSAARRLVEQKGVRLDDVVVTDASQVVEPASRPVIQVGKRQFLQVEGTLRD